jgi:pyridoxal phosphate enzyme (YggS family)
MNSISDNLHQVRAQIDAAAQRFGRDPADIQLLAVSKTKPAALVLDAFKAGQRCFGENYLQDALPKIQALAEYPLEWHYIGPLQSNKTRAIAENFAWLHSLDTLKHARRLSEQRPAKLPPLNVCIQVNISREAQKAGVLLEALDDFAGQVLELPGLKLRGLMTLPAYSEDFAQQRQAFRALRAALEHLPMRLDVLSMGMSGDLDAAIAEGATIVRIGTAIFGART